METPESEKPTHPKGFLRRNWPALIFFAAILQFSVTNIIIQVASHWNIAAYKGDFGVAYVFWGDPSNSPRVVSFQMDLKNPNWGTMPKVADKKYGNLYSIPIWLPLSLSVLWIGCWEWRKNWIKLKK